MDGSLVGLILAMAVGCAAAAVNYLLTKSALASQKGGGFLGALSAVRLLLSAGVLAGVYFVAPLTPCDRTWMLVGAAAGLTLPMLLFTPRLLRQANGNPQNHDNTESTDRKGGE